MLLFLGGSIGSKTNFISETLFPTCWKKNQKKFCFLKTLLLTHKTYSHAISAQSTRRDFQGYRNQSPPFIIEDTAAGTTDGHDHTPL